MRGEVLKAALNVITYHKHESGCCVRCEQPETVEYVLIKCKGYERMKDNK